MFVTKRNVFIIECKIHNDIIHVVYGCMGSILFIQKNSVNEHNHEVL